jgi:DNA-directed RNA polymerase subunit RPC12/RpoP
MSLEVGQIQTLPQGLPDGLTMDEVLAAIEADEYVGFCLQCGAEQGGCEPDARHYECEECGARQVFGAEEILIMFGG